jgi:tRNA pseudouridine55 synthase
MATGVLLIMLGDCTKLSRFLSLENKSYEATVRLGQETDTFDAQGTIISEAPVPDSLLNVLKQVEKGNEDAMAGSVLEKAIHDQRLSSEQVPPLYSAIKHQGVPSYRRARRGEQMSLPARPIRVSSLELLGASLQPPSLSFRLDVSKGYYVRSFARDLGQGMGTLAHLSELRRTRSGSWGLEDAVAMDADGEIIRNSLISLEKMLSRELPTAMLKNSGVLRALRGQPLSEHDFDQPPARAISAWFDERGRLIAVGDWSRGHPTVLRGYYHIDEVC